MRIVNEIRRRHRAWVDAGRPGVLSEAQLVERITRLEYAVRSFAQWYAAHDCREASPSGPHRDAVAIAEEVFARGYELGLAAQPNNAAMDIEALLLEMAERDAEEVAGRLSTGERERLDAARATIEKAAAARLERFKAHDGPCSTACAHAPERFGLDAPPPRLLVVPGDYTADSDQPGMHGEGTFP